MNRTRFWLIALAGLLLPFVLAATVFAISSRIDAKANIPGLPTTETTTPATSPHPSPSDDHGDRCTEPEHRDDPSCVSDSATPHVGPSGSADDHGGSKGSSGGSGSSSGTSGSSSGGDDHSGTTESGSGSGSSSGGSGSSSHSGGGDD